MKSLGIRNNAIQMRIQDGQYVKKKSIRKPIIISITITRYVLPFYVQPHMHTLILFPVKQYCCLNS